MKKSNKEKNKINIEYELILKRYSWSVLSLIQLNNGTLVSSTIKFLNFNFDKSNNNKISI